MGGLIPPEGGGIIPAGGGLIYGCPIMPGGGGICMAGGPRGKGIGGLIMPIWGAPASPGGATIGGGTCMARAIG